MPAMKKTIPFQVPGQSSVKVPINSSNHSGKSNTNYYKQHCFFTQAISSNLLK